jgi:SAM-dependent methyltransferase
MTTTPADRHLDLGCGSKPRNPYTRRSLCGVDLQPSAAERDVELRAANIVLEPIPWPDDHFASVSAFDFIEHVPRILTTADGKATWFPFVALMNEIWRVLAPAGRLYALTPAYPSPTAFVDPTHVNFITANSHEYFCGDAPLGRMYGFQGRFRALRVEWTEFADALDVQPRPRTLRGAFRRWRRQRRGKLTHMLWELEALKP